ncbi:MAG TPA: hypothetical protein VFV38_13770 [Ktedonobacteraceae bacterium]|nr:hypothetical protein [Ktedonobacteraceae bacterium]
MQYMLATLAERPELEDQVATLYRAMLPVIGVRDASEDRYQETLFCCFPEYQLMFYDEQDQVVAFGNAIPTTWDGTVSGLSEGWDVAYEHSISEHACQRQPTTLLALGVGVKPALRGRAISGQVLQAMRQLALTHKLLDIIAPVRPTFKCRYPLIAMEDYASWTRQDGLPFDPWIRVHARLGARILKIAPRSTIVTGTVQEWERWAGMPLPHSGSYILPEALVPITISCERNEGRYEEPNVWMQHPLTQNGD